MAQVRPIMPTPNTLPGSLQQFGSQPGALRVPALENAINNRHFTVLNTIDKDTGARIRVLLYPATEPSKMQTNSSSWNDLGKA